MRRREGARRPERRGVGGLSRGGLLADSRLRSTLRFAAVGLAQNGLSYLLVLGLTMLGLAPWLAFAIIFPVAVAASYWFNSRWTFGERSQGKAVIYAYTFTYVSAYGLTLIVSALLATFGLPDALTVFLTIGVIGLYTFLVLDRGVFR